MRRTTFQMILMMLLPLFISAQPCLPEGIKLFTQGQIDSFAVNYPQCTKIDGDLQIGGSDAITNLNGLNGITEVGGGFIVYSCHYLIDLSGMENLTNIDGDLSISFCSKLESLNGLDNLATVGGTFYMFNNLALKSFNAMNKLKSVGNNMSIGVHGFDLVDFKGLENLNTIGDSLTLYKNHGLTSLSGLDNLVSIGGSLKIGMYHKWLDEDEGNNSLRSLSGLENLTSIGKNLEIRNNTRLNNIDGLINLDKGSIQDLTIIKNDSLAVCHLQNICDYLSAPSGVVTIYQNASGCDNPPEIAANCGFDMPCLPFGDYYFLTQVEIDEFKTNYPECVELKGNVEISGDSITDVMGFSEVTSVDGKLRFYQNYLLTSLQGFNKLEYVGGNLFFRYNDALINLSELSNLKAVGGELRVEYNKSLNSMTGLEGINTFSDILVYGNDSLEDLRGLDNVTKVNGGAYIFLNNSLESFSGLDKLTAIDSGLRISQHSKLVDLSALSKLNSVGGYLHIMNNYSLPGIHGLENLVSVGADVSIYNNDLLLDLSGLKNLTTIGDFLSIEENDTLSDLTGLKSLVSIDGSLYIDRNKSLRSLTGLENIEAGSIQNLMITFNGSLWNCAIKSICDYLSSPGGEIAIYGNKEGCSSAFEIESGCESPFVEEKILKNSLIAYPNPFTSSITFEFRLSAPAFMRIKVYGQFGEILMTHSGRFGKGLQKVQIPAKNLTAGMYYCEIETDKELLKSKLIKLY